MQLTESGFASYRCDSNAVLGIQFAALSKILKCMTSKDSLSIQAQSDGDVVNFIFESMDQKRYSNFELKLNDIDQEQLGIPDTEYDTIIEMPSAEFQRICRDLAAIGDTVTISATKQGVKFSVNGDIGSGEIRLRNDRLGADKQETGGVIQSEGGAQRNGRGRGRRHDDERSIDIEQRRRRRGGQRRNGRGQDLSVRLRAANLLSAIFEQLHQSHRSQQPGRAQDGHRGPARGRVQHRRTGRGHRRTAVLPRAQDRRR